jgi:outer membrane protein OmpA-like peptidoglycan-associated protein
MNYIKIIFFFSFLFLPDLSLLAQADKELVEDADETYKIGAKLLALEKYELAMRANPNNARATFMAGKCILETIDKGRASTYFLKAYQLNPSIDPDILYFTAQAFQLGREFDKAIGYYEKYKQQLISKGVKPKKKKKGQADPTDILASIDTQTEQCRNGKKYTADPLEYAITNLGEAVNTEFPDYAPAVNRDESLVIFTSRRVDGVGQNNVDNDLLYFEDIWFSEKKDGKWQPARNIGTNVNNEFHDASIGLSGDGKELFLYKDDNGGDIFISKHLDDSTWSKPESISPNINSSYNENSVCISPDGNTLLFTSDRPGGKGGIDIYMSKKEKGGGWGKPVSLAAPINTPENDDSPFLDYDGKTLYFSSKAHKGMGGYDIFISQYDSSSRKWSEPVNMGYPINTPDDDIYFVKSGDSKYGYYASVKDGGLGETDIYKVLIPEPIQTYQKLRLREIQGPPAKNLPVVITVDNREEKRYPVNLIINIREEGTGVPQDAKVIFTRRSDGVEIGLTKISTGVYRTTFSNADSVLYHIVVENQGSMFKNEDLNIPAMGSKEQTIVRNYEMAKIQVGFKTVLRNIYFDFDKATFKMESYDELKKLERTLKENPGYRVEIGGHTDSKGGPAYNDELSQRRANAVVEWLIQKGIGRNRLSAKGYGESKPLATNDDEQEGREINRRTEFSVLEDLTSQK